MDIEDYKPETAPTVSRPVYRETIRYESRARSRGRFRRTVVIAIIISFFGGCGLGLGYSAGLRFADEYWGPESDGAALKTFSITPLSADEDDLPLSYADAISAAEPAVVRISAVKAVHNRFSFTEGERTVSNGTGMLFHETDNNYYIATNAHVVSGSTGLYVFLGDNTAVDAVLVGEDDAKDVAVISVNKNAVAGSAPLGLVSFGDSDAVRVGDVVLAIGNALGEGNSATNGIISAKDKIIEIDGVAFEVIQTNAAINEGNSGGPLINLNGEVIGMNTAKLKENKDSKVEGMGYSIPSNIIVPTIEKIMRGGGPKLGVTTGDITSEYRYIYGVDVQGALIQEIKPGGAAEKSGLRAGDVVLAVDGKTVTGSQSLIDTLSEYTAGNRVGLTILRGGTLIIDAEATLLPE
ncbi:MAG: trypsin-like peptidase domain-containing protein [Clostridiales bacterium]|jgi:serine protease Do|nr:trypsin-like peptidase domain-containing protein [Clostridiales bacterium]